MLNKVTYLAITFNTVNFYNKIRIQINEIFFNLLESVYSVIFLCIPTYSF